MDVAAELRAKIAAIMQSRGRGDEWQAMRDEQEEQEQRRREDEHAMVGFRQEVNADVRAKLPRIELQDEQIDAFAAILAFLRNDASGHFTLMGLAGTGKTTVLAAVAQEYLDRAVACSPTGKAASVLSRKIGLQVRTIHSTLYKAVRNEETGAWLGWRKKFKPGEAAGRIAVVDEASMVDERLGKDLLEAGFQIVAAGDPGQLPPVEARPFFTTADFTLQQIRRQALNSPIIRQAHRVRQNLPYETDGDAFQVISREQALADTSWPDIIVCWRNETRHRINRYFRRQRGIAPTALPRAGEPIICLENSEQMLNGETSVVTTNCVDDEPLVLDNGQSIYSPWFETISEPDTCPRGYQPFALAYAITVHKAQGSEWPRVLIVDDFGIEHERARWLYTAISRAAEAVRIVPAGG
jgi:exodeoxyribonuclease V